MMEINIPILVRRSKETRSGVKHFCEPLFKDHTYFHAEGEDLGKTIRRLTDAMRKWATMQVHEQDQSHLGAWDMSDPIETHHVKLHLTLSDQTVRANLLLVKITKGQNTIVFSPTLPHVWFDLRNDETLTSRASEVYTAHFNQCIKDRNEQEIAEATSSDALWIDSIRIAVDTNTVPKKPANPLLAFLGGQSVSDGANELMQVGRCLDWVDMDSLADPIGLDGEVTKILERFTVADRRGLVLLGPSGSGKTAAIEGAVRKRRMSLSGSERKKGLVWQLTPARLISGMSYLGQWQSRLIAIWKHAYRNDLILYIEDMLGLFEAGVTRDSRACAADLIRAQMEVMPVRLVTEMTPEAWAIFREKDRAFAQQFLVLPLEGKSRDDSLEILLGMISMLESKHLCRFDHAVLPEVLGLYDRFDRTAVLPGKAISALERLANTHARKAIDRNAAQQEFIGRTGLSKLVIDSDTSLTREQVVASIGEHVFGQKPAIEKIADRILAASARINDTSRPLGVFLLMGPTGVGKTELAKTVAQFLFGEEGLIRIDMNELSTADAAARLVGTFSSPDGILTVAARRRPHAVLLLDEIEKADASVLDTLLQVIGEARLTDARGRTVDLSGMMILMTSNLGASHSDRSTVLSQAKSSRSEAYRKAARNFFRPEFFNRIDGLIEFDSLDLDVVAEVAQRQVEHVLKRDGLGRRRMVVEIEREVLRDVVRRGFDPRLGARAVKRQIEREVVTPIAKVLVESQGDELMILHARAERDGLELSVGVIGSVPLQPAANDDATTVNRLVRLTEQTLDQIESEKPSKPVSISTSGNGIDPMLLRRLALQDQMQACADAMKRIEELNEQTQSPSRVVFNARTGRGRPMMIRCVSDRVFLLDLQAINDVHQYLRESTESSTLSDLQVAARDLRRELHRLKMLQWAMLESEPQSLVIESYGDRSRTQSHDADSSSSDGTLRAILMNAAVTLLGRDGSEASKQVVSDGRRLVLPMQDPVEIAACALMVGGWLRVDDFGNTAYAHVRLRPQSIHASAQQTSSKSWNEEALPPIRWILTHAQGIDLKTAEVIRDADPKVIVCKLLSNAAPPYGLFDELSDEDTVLSL